jgi:hypothetical protein
VYVAMTGGSLRFVEVLNHVQVAADDPDERSIRSRSSCVPDPVS